MPLSAECKVQELCIRERSAAAAGGHEEEPPDTEEGGEEAASGAACVKGNEEKEGSKPVSCSKLSHLHACTVQSIQSVCLQKFAVVYALCVCLFVCFVVCLLEFRLVASAG